LTKSSVVLKSKPDSAPVRVAIYGRISDLGQGEDASGFKRHDASPEAQKNRCEDYLKFLAQKKGKRHQVVEHLSDEGYSGKNTNRPKFQRLWDLISAQAIDLVISTELSRLSRNVLDFLELVAHAEKNKVDIVIIGIDLDTSLPIGRMLVIVLVALAQFEREMTSVRVRENALSRLVNHGKINGAGEILGLERDANNPGHFLVSEEELVKAEKILNLFLKFSSKKRVLEAAKAMGITGIKGRGLTRHMLDSMLHNVKWRYRGLWPANKESVGSDQDSLPESKRYQVVKLPHGSLLPEKLLDAVEAKTADTRQNRKQCGKDGYVYLLSHSLYFEDGSKFTGQIGKNLRYYYNQKNKIRLRGDDLDPFILKEVKQRFLDHEKFEAMVQAAIKRRQIELPSVERRIAELERQLVKLGESDIKLRALLLDDGGGSPNNEVMDWLSPQVEDMTRQRRQLEAELEDLSRQRNEVLRKSGLVDLQKSVKELLDRFEDLTGTEKRNVIEKIVKRITVHRGNRLSIEFYGDPPPLRSVNLRNKKCDPDRNGSSGRI
jgi:DNA invertase Pin-like site-specific DNA recombinase